MTLLTATKVVKWETSDGKIHSSKEMADQYIMNAEMCERIDVLLTGSDSPDAQDIVNWMTSNAKNIREFLDSCDAMEKASLR